MIVPRRLRRPIRSMPILLALGLAAPAAAQQSVYIGQVDPTAAAPPRRSTNQNSVEPLLVTTNPAVTGLPVAGPAANSLPAIVTASGQSGTLTPGQTQNIAVIDQAGSSNRSTIVQTGAGNDARTTVAGTGNVTAQTQDGSSNRSALGILGDGNSLTNAQTGSSNNANISVVGSGYVITNTQTGSNLSYGLSVSSTNAGDKNITVDQRSIVQTQGQTANGLSPSISSVISGRSAR